MSPVSNYKKWLAVTAAYWGIPKDAVLIRKHNQYIVNARQTFYTLCLRDKIDLYALSLHLGKERTTVYTSFRHFKGNVTEHVNKILKQNK